MYKTIRHGENSLQYTILPQNDDFRIDGKLNSASNIGGGGKPRRAKRRSFCAYLGLLFVCTVIIGAVLVPYLVSADCLPNPAKWFKYTKASFIISDGDHAINFDDKHVGTIPVIPDKPLSASARPKPIIDSSIKPYPLLKVNNSKPLVDSIKGKAPTVITRKVLDKNFDSSSQQDELSSASINSNEKYEYSPVATDHVIAEMRRLTDAPNNGKKSINEKLIVGPFRMSMEKPTVTTTLPISMTTTSTSPPTITSTGSVPTRFMAILKSTSKKPIILPVLAKTNSIDTENDNSVDQQTIDNKSKWLVWHWPSADWPIYFRYSARNGNVDNGVLYRIMVGLAIFGIFLGLVFCLIITYRNKFGSFDRNKKRNTKNNAEDTNCAEDNTNLLNSAHLSDDE